METSEKAFEERMEILYDKVLAVMEILYDKVLAVTEEF